MQYIRRLKTTPKLRLIRLQKGSDNINQYLYQREDEALSKLKAITSGNFDEYRAKLQKIKDNSTYETILPFTEFVIGLILSGEDVPPDKLNDWWLVYSNTLEYNGGLLKHMTNALCYDLSNSLTKAFKVNIFTRFFRWIKNKIKTR